MKSMRNAAVYRVDSRNCPREFSHCLSVPSPPLMKPSRVSFTLSLPAIPTEVPPDGYRRNVGIVLVSPSKKIFTGLRIRVPHTWQMPQGGANDGEDLRKAAIRELREETGVTSAEFLAEVPYWLTYDFPRNIKTTLNQRWKSNYKGQAQKWFLLKFTGKEDEINLYGDGSVRPEFRDWRWVFPEHLLEMSNVNKPVYQRVFEVFSPYFSNNLTLVKPKDCPSPPLTLSLLPLAIPTEVLPEGYQRIVGIVLVNPSKQIFTGSRIRVPHTWQMPQGSVDDGEDLRKAAIRELRADTGVISVEFIAEVPYWLTYDFPHDIKTELNRRWKSNYKGLAQKWFLFKFTGKEDEINLYGDGSERPEFREWRWVFPAHLLANAGKFQKPVYQQVFEVFSSYISSKREKKPKVKVRKQRNYYQDPVRGTFARIKKLIK